jgi:hypothetical protein
LVKVSELLKEVVKPLSVAAQTFVELQEDEQEHLRCLAMPALWMCSKGDYKGAKGYLDSLGLDDTYYTAIWSLFHSTQRRLMKS